MGLTVDAEDAAVCINDGDRVEVAIVGALEEADCTQPLALHHILMRMLGGGKSRETTER